MRYKRIMHPARLPSCVYCGNEAQAVDHVYPQSRRTTTPHEMDFEVACCWECNSAANATVFPTFEAKATWLLVRAMKKGRVQWQMLESTAPIVQNYLNQRRNGTSTAQLDVEEGLSIRKRKRNLNYSELYESGSRRAKRPTVAKIRQALLRCTT